MVAAAASLAASVALTSGWHPGGAVAARDSATILGASATSLDPVAQSDAGSAQVVSQLFESLTAVDAQEHVQPALAANWETSNGGKQVVFHLRSGLEYSDGTSITGKDVVSSWLRVLNPSRPSQLASLMDDVVGAKAYRQGKGAASAVGISAPNDGEVQVNLANPASDFPAIVSSPTLAVVPPDIDTNPGDLRPGTFVGSGAYVLSALTDTETTMTANSHYWAGKPSIGTVHLLSQLPNGQSSVTAFQAGSLDYTPVSAGDATWIAYDKTLGPSLRIEPSPSVEYYGFNTTRPPFDNVHVRRAFELGIDWKRIVTLLGNPLVVPATGMVPAGVPGHSSTDFGPKFDVATAKSELAAAGYANGVGFPHISLVTSGAALDAAIVAQVKTNLGIDISYEALDWPIYNQALLSDPPSFWEMDWVADYPGANDFLGILLGDGQTNNFARWSNKDFESALASALSASDATSMQAAFDKAQSIVQDQAPVIPVDYGAGYALAAPGLLGALPNSQGLVRYAGLSWAAGS
jgi:ABC-type oligopeptide transport system substrate-binding subunit